MNEMLKKLITVVMLLAGSVWVVSCATSNDSRVTPAVTAEAADSTPAVAAPAPAETGDVKGGAKDLSTQKQKLFQYVLTLSDPSQPFTETDREFLASLQPAPESGSLREAAIVVGTLRACLEDVGNLQSFKEKDLTVAAPQNTIQSNATSSTTDPVKSPAVKKGGTAVSLEGRLADKQVQLVQSLQKNMLLRSHRVFYLVQKVLSLTENSEPYAKELNQLIADEATQWAQLLPKGPLVQPLPIIGAAQQPSAAVPAGTPPVTPPADVAAKGEPNKSAVPLVLSPSSQQPEALLVSAQQLADNGQFKQAVDQARKIGTSDPAYPAAKDKIKTFSNQAVQTLRQKAAQAFQNAMPAADAGVKSAYLEQARVYLEQALSDFPEADSLDTVKENLAVITKDIERLETQKSTVKKAKASSKAKKSDGDETVIQD